MKILNLDKLSQNTGRVLTIDSVQHPIIVMGVDDFIATTERVQLMEKDGAGETEQLKFALDVICKLVPSVPRERFGKYDLPTLNTIANFVRGEDVEEQEAAVEAEAGK